MEQLVEDHEPPRRLPRATLAATVLLAASAFLSFAFVVQRGGIALPEIDDVAAAPTFAPVVTSPPASPAASAVVAAPTATATATATPDPTASPIPPTARPTPTTASTPTATRSPTAPPGQTPSPTPSPAPTSAPTPQPSATPSPTPQPTAMPSPTPQPAATPSPTPRATATPRPTIDTGTASQSRLALLTPCPSRADCWVYVIRRGDNLTGIATFFGVTLERIYAMNPDVSPNALRVGVRLLIPTPTR